MTIQSWLRKNMAQVHDVVSDTFKKYLSIPLPTQASGREEQMYSSIIVPCHWSGVGVEWYILADLLSKVWKKDSLPLLFQWTMKQPHP